jgi:HD-GYP domain-containing protein (c-di-GMP phosphodiesterase class II)
MDGPFRRSVRFLRCVITVSRLLSSLIGAATAAVALRTWQKRRNSERLAAATFEVLLNAIDANDEVTGAHVRRVARYALILGDAAGLDEAQLRSVERIALFHDIGKIHSALYDIIHDDDKLTADERRAIATHPRRGSDVLAPLSAFYPELGDGVLAHHERWDGKGYPRCLAGDVIPLEARIVAIADTFDAITHSRRYRAGESSERAADVVAKGRGTQFDPSLADIFLSPAVFKRIEAAMHDEYRTRPKRPERRRREQERDVPDVKFRWRTPPSNRSLSVDRLTSANAE